jgi:erythromycin esterase-like protein
VTSDPNQDKSPSWSPDGKYLAFHSDRDGNFEIYTIKVDGLELNRVTNTLAFDGFPSWQPIVSAGSDEVALSEPRPEDIEQQRALNLLTWLSANAIPVTSIEPSMIVDDLLSLRDVIGEVKVVDLRGLTLGSHESFTIRHRILQFLVRELGFDTIVMGVSRDEGSRINQYLQTGDGDPALLLAEFADPRWNTQEMLAIIEWLYRYNQDPETEVKMSLYGVGRENPLIPIDLLVANLLQMDLGTADRREFIYDYLGERSEHLIENVNWLIGEISPTSRIALLGYDFDILDAVRLAQEDFVQQMTFHPTIGSLLRDYYQEDPFRFGFTFGKGLIQAYDSLLEDRTLLTMQIPPAPSGSFEWFAHNIALPIFIVPTQPASGDQTDTVWLDQPLRSRMIIGMFSPTSPDGFFYTVRLSRVYDAIIYVDQTTPPQLLPILTEMETDQSESSCPTEGICIR